MIGGVFQLKEAPDLLLLYDGKVESIGWGEEFWRLDDHVEYCIESLKEDGDSLILPRIFL